MKDLAVLIPVFNDAGALVETLDSISETENDFTVFVVDDGSRTPVEVDASRYPFAVRIVRLEKNLGIVGALTRGLELIREEGYRFVARLDAADLNRPGRFRRQYDLLERKTELALVGTNVAFRDEGTGEQLFTTKLPLETRGIRRWMVFRNCFIHPSVMMRTEAVEAVGGYSANFPHIEDYVLFSQLAERFPSANLPEPMVDCFVRSQGISLRHGREQLISGIRFKMGRPRPWNPLWWAFLIKRVSYLALPLEQRVRIKRWLGFVDRNEPQEPAELVRPA